MDAPLLDFMSDNCAGASPEVIEAVVRTLAGRSRSYGHDGATARAVSVLRDLFEAPEAEILFVPTGTAANALALAVLCPPWGAVYCSDCAHLDVDECGAPTFFTGGATLRLLPHDRGLIGPDTLGAALSQGRLGDVHAVQPAALSIAQITERGAVYTPEAVGLLADMARGAGLRCHMDGARLANAVSFLGCAPADITWRAGIDILSLGATKNGALGVEAVICFDPALARELGFRRKRAGHLLSKMRVASAQIEAMFGSDLWLRLAAHANAMAMRLAEGLGGLRGVEIVNRPEGNILFASFAPATDAALRRAGARYSARRDGSRPAEARLVTAFDTRVADVDAFLAAARSAI